MGMNGRLDYGRALDRAPLSVGGGRAEGMEIAGAAIEQMWYVDNVNAAGVALEEAYLARSRAIKAATGIDLGNPMFGELAGFDEEQARRLANGEFGAELEVQRSRIEQQRAAYERRLRELEAQFPDKKDVIRANVSIADDAAGLARAKDERLASLMASNPDWTSHVWAFGGAAAGSFRDPLVIASLPLGGAFGGAKTAAGAIVRTALAEALINGATTAAAQPFVQDWRKRAGLANGFDQAAANVLFAAALGGVIGGAGEGVGQLVGRAGRRAANGDQVRAFLEANPDLSQTARRALDGDTSAATTMLAEIRDVLPPDVRGAIDVLQQAEAREAERQATIAHLSAQRHEELVQRAARTEQMRALPDLVIEDKARINRLVRDLAPSPGSITDRLGVLGDRPDFAATVADLRAGARGGDASRRPLAAFLKRLGGVDPGSPIAAELRAIGITSSNSPGLFSRQGRRALDNIPLDELPDDMRPFAGADDGNGYVREQAFVDGLAAELEGRPWRTADETAAQGLDDYRRYLEDNGVDFERMSDEEIRQQLEAIDDAERRFLAAEPNELGLSTDEVAFLPPGVTRRAYTADIVRQVLARTGEGVSDDVVKMAADAVIVAGETVDDAVGFALSQAAGVRKTLPENQFAELPPEPPAPPKDAPVDPPDEDAIDWAALEEEGFTGAIVPFGDDLMSLEALKQELDDTAWLERVVDACKL